MVDGWDHPSFSFYLCTVKIKVGHTASERRVLGSKSNFSPGASLWFSMWSSLSSLRSSNPSTTAILFPPRYLQSRKNPHIWLLIINTACNIESYSQFGELLQAGEILQVSDVVVLQEQMGEVEGKAKVVNVWYPVIIQVQDGEASTHGNITLETEFKC